MDSLPHQVAEKTRSTSDSFTVPAKVISMVLPKLREAQLAWGV